MKKLIYSLTNLSVVAGMIFLNSCGTTPPEVKPTAGKPSVAVSFDPTTYGVQKDFEVSAVVSTTGDSAYVTISVNGTKPTGAIYVMYQKDNEKAVKFTKQPNGTNLAAAGFKGSAFDGTKATNFNSPNLNDFTFNIPATVKNAWKVVVPILLRKDATAKSDAFTIWVTQDGKPGEFKNPAKNLAYGVATVTLNYTNEKLINFYETTLGNSSDSTGSLFSSKYGTNYTRANANASVELGKSIDFVYNTGSATSPKAIFGSFYTSTNVVDADVAAGFSSTGLNNITNYTKIASVAGTVFDAVTGEDSLAAEVDKVITATTTTNKIHR